MKKRKPTKANNASVTMDFLKRRAAACVAAGYTKQKWVEFCEIMLNKGFECTIYEARQTFSKYITVRDSKHHSFKVRFSNHRPIKQREINGDCDFFVGITNLKVTNTAQAVLAALRFFDSVTHG